MKFKATRNDINTSSFSYDFYLEVVIRFFGCFYSESDLISYLDGREDVILDVIYEYFKNFWNEGFAQSVFIRCDKTFRELSECDEPFYIERLKKCVLEVKNYDYSYDLEKYINEVLIK